MNIKSNIETQEFQKDFNRTSTNKRTMITKGISTFLWILFIANIFVLLFNFNMPQWNYGTLFKINRFTLLIWTSVTFFSAIVSSYAGNYLNGSRFQSKFMFLCLAFTLSVMLLVFSNHIILFISSWLLMGILMSELIGIDKKWGEAQEALKFTRKYFLTGTGFLTVGLLLLAFYSDDFEIDSIVLGMMELPLYIVIPSAVCVIIAAILQSAIYPFHRWLLSAMTAPTPASALMHAGFVNGAGILLAVFSTLLFASNTLTILFIIGGFTAIIAQFAKLLQVNVKQKLACSTIAQMGFMIMQCGLGFFNAAVAHLILHGFYKAYLFLSSGEEVLQTKPEKPIKLKIKPIQLLVVFLFGGFGAYLFAILTGKGMSMNSGIFLTLVVAITVGQATYNFIKEKSLSIAQKAIWPPILFISGIVIYALLYNGITILMADMPMSNQPLPLSWTQIIFGIIFLLGFFIMKLGVYKKLPWLYVKLMNLSQPNKKTFLMYKSKSV